MRVVLETSRAMSNQAPTVDRPPNPASTTTVGAPSPMQSSAIRRPSGNRTLLDAGISGLSLVAPAPAVVPKLMTNNAASAEIRQALYAEKYSFIAHSCHSTSARHSGNLEVDCARNYWKGWARSRSRQAQLKVRFGSICDIGIGPKADVALAANEQTFWTSTNGWKTLVTPMRRGNTPFATRHLSRLTEM